MAPNYLKRMGYRLPTKGEWEYANRVNAETEFYFGESQELLPKYGSITVTNYEPSRPVGLLKPNDLGLFDTNGNVLEWLQDASRRSDVKAHDNRKVCDDQEDIKDMQGISDSETRRARARGVYSHNTPNQGGNDLGFRPAKTVKP